MPRYLALDADANVIQLLSAKVKGDAVRLEQTLSWDNGQPLTSATAQQVGAQLRDQMRSAGIAAAPLLVAVGRDRVILKEIRIPPVAEHEEPALVRFQAIKEFAEGADDVVLDYVPLGPPSPEGRRVQVLSVRKDVVKSYRVLAEAAGLKLAAITPRPFALVAGMQQAIRMGIVPPPPVQDSSVALLARSSKWGEFAIVRRGVPLLSRSMAGPALGSDAGLLGEIRRNLALHANQNPTDPVRALYLAEADTPGGLRERLQQSLAIPVYAYEPVVGVTVPDGPPGTLAGLAGLFALRSAHESSINFIQPREPRQPRDPNQRLLIVGAAMALLFVSLLGGAAFMRVEGKKTEVRRLQRELDDTQELLRSQADESKRIKALDEWAATDVNWLDELYNISSMMNDTRHVRLLSITATPIEDRGKDKKAVASIELRGLASANPVPRDSFLGQLAKEPGYDLKPKRLKPNTAIDRNLFVEDFTTRIELERRPPDKYTRTFTANPPPKRKSRQPDEEPRGENAGAREEGR